MPRNYTRKSERGNAYSNKMLRTVEHIKSTVENI